MGYFVRTETVYPGETGPPSGPFQPDDPSGPCAGKVFAERNEILGTLGTGGHAVVQRAFDRELRTEVALKILRTDRLSSGARVRLRRELKVARDVVDPHLVRIFDLATVEGKTFLSMELVEGETLEARLRRGPLSTAETLAAAKQILSGLRALHRAGIVHRDVKPSNVLIARDGRVLLADFGLALRLDGSETRATLQDGLVGTLDYLSPEQVLGRPVDARTDLYSLGLVLHECLTGRPAWDAKSSAETLLSRIRSRPPNPRSRRSELPRWLDRVVHRSLQPDPARRYASAEELLRDLEERRFRRRWTPKGARAVRAAAATALLLALAGVLAARFQPGAGRLDFERLAPAETGIQALDGNGETLWRHDGVDPGIADRSVLARLAPGTPRKVVTVLHPEDDLSPGAVRTLSVLEPSTGSIEREVKLPLPLERFPEYSEYYRPEQVDAVDLDGDGVDEILVTYVHVPYAPSFTVLYEPTLDRVRVLFGAVGHHRYAGAHDLTGDGRAEVFLLGINNDLNWYNALTAVQIRPWIGEPSSRQPLELTMPPTARELPNVWRDLLWYALLPPGRPAREPDAVAADPRSRTLAAHFVDGSAVRLDFHGFPADVQGGPEAGERTSLRSSAYDHLREVRRLLAAGFPREAVAEANAGAELARRAALPMLEEALLQLRGRALVVAGQHDEARAAFHELAGRASSPSDVAYAAAEAFHARGALEEALRWYERGLGPGGGKDRGREKADLLRGGVLALAELERWEDAMSWVRRYEASYEIHGGKAEAYPAFIRWRRGNTSPPAELAPAHTAPDLERYWALELDRSESGAPSDDLLQRVEAELRRSSRTRPLLHALRAELLAELGRLDEAARAAQDSREGMARTSASDPLLRVHAPVVEEHLAAVAEDRGAAPATTGRSGEPGEEP
ncbi:MAG: protein kinase domain-containing protein [Thermoanaerobaculia bacterium]